MMILDARSPALRKLELPESPARSAGFIPSERWNSLVYFGASGRAWRLDFNRDGSAAVSEIGVRVDDPDMVEPQFFDMTADRVAFGYGDTVRVYDLRTARLLLELPDDGFFATCLTADGRYLLQFGGERTLLWSLDVGRQAPFASSVFHLPDRRLPGHGYSPQSATRLTRGDQPAVFHIFVGHVAFAIDYTVAFKPSTGPDLSLSAPPRLHTNFIFDPVYAFAGGWYPRVAISDGYGTKLRLLDVETGVMAVCPRSADETSSGYVHYREVVPGGDKWYVNTADGWFIWNLQTNTSERFCDLAFDVVHVGRDFVWMIDWGSLGVLVKYAVER